MSKKPKLKKETFRFFAEDLELIRRYYPGGRYGEIGPSEVIRSVVHSWVDSNLKHLETDSGQPPEIG